MADITKCANKTCPKKEYCYRQTAKDSIWQSYSAFEPEEDGECDSFWLDTGVTEEYDLFGNFVGFVRK